MTKVAVSRWGNSTAIRLPRAVVDALGLVPGQTVDLTVEDGKAVLSAPPRSPRRVPTLEEMVAEMDRLGWENEPATVDWGRDVGSERFYDDD
jgi:antitoxin MazE